MSAGDGGSNAPTPAHVARALVALRAKMQMQQGSRPASASVNSAQ